MKRASRLLATPNRLTRREKQELSQVISALMLKAFVRAVGWNVRLRTKRERECRCTDKGLVRPAGNPGSARRNRCRISVGRASGRYEKRSHAACRVMPSALPMASQLTLRRLSSSICA